MVVPSYLLLVLIMALPGGGQEELGWRGYALAPLQKRFGALWASLSLGAIWGFWHLPLYVLIVGYNNAGSSAASIAWAFAGFVGYTVVLSTILGWVYDGTRASVLLVMLVHGSMNSLFAFAPATATASWCLTGAFGALALLVVLATRGRLGCDVPRTQRPRSDELDPRYERSRRVDLPMVQGARILSRRRDFDSRAGHPPSRAR
jgi:membrane protease YdiL (CAAX protease family)